MLSVLSGKGYSVKLPCLGIYDFITDKWGNTNKSNPHNETKRISKPLPNRINNVLILNDGNKDEILDALNCLVKMHPHANYTLLITDDRTDFFDEGFQNIIKVNTEKSYSLIYLSRIFIKILGGNYDIAINFKHTSPFSYAVRRAYSYNHTGKEFEETNYSLKNIWKLAVSTIFGEVTSILLLPVICISSFRYEKHIKY